MSKNVLRDRGQGVVEYLLLAAAICVWAFLEISVLWWAMAKDAGRAAQEAARMAAEMARQKGIEMAEKYASAITRPNCFSRK
ncbi:hypothetical protein [Methanopyrus sp.]